MKSTSLAIAGKVNPAVRAVYRRIDDAASSLGIDWLVVGATARDLIYQAAFDVKVIRATVDIDLAVHVDSWDAFSTRERERISRRYDARVAKAVRRRTIVSSAITQFGQGH